MPRYELEYPKEPFSTVKRYDSRASYALETIHRIINTSPILHVSFQAPGSPFPAVLPMLGRMGSFDRPSADLGDVLDLYLHGYVSSRIMNLSRDSSSSSSNSNSGDDAAAGPEEGEGLPLTIAATHFDGLVLALSPNAHSYNYRSAVLFGHAVPVASPAERLWAMELITDGVVPSRWQHTRVPPNKAELSSTTILRVRVSHGSAKVRQGMPHDERCDMEDEAVLDRVWSGVVPAYTVMGEPLPGPYNRVAEVPGYLSEWVRDGNEVRRGVAVEEMTKEPEVKKGKGE